MRMFLRTKTGTFLSLLTLFVLLSGMMALSFVSNSATAHAASKATTSQLKLQFLGTNSLGPGQTVVPGPSSRETAPGEEEDRDPRLAINGPTPPLPPPPSGTLAPNPKPQNVISNNAGFRGFNGLTHADQRQAGTGQYTNTQFSLEPPDQGLCVSSRFVLDTVNTALTVRDTSGKVLSGPTPINQFFNLKPEVDRAATPPVFGDFTSDPKCYFDPDTQRWFLTVLQSDVDPATGAFTGPSHVLVAVSQSSDPNGKFGLFAINTTNDGTNGTPAHSNCPCLGDQPLLGTDANGVYITTNEFPQFSNGFNGAQVYAISKRAMVKAASGSATPAPTVVLIDASQSLAPYGGLSYSIQPATQPLGSFFGRENGGTEYFLSALDFNGSIDNRIAAWALTNTSSLDKSAPDVKLSFTVIRSQVYGQPVNVVQKDGPRPQGQAQGLPAGKLNSNDDRMNQVVYSAGVLWSGVNTIVQKPGEDARAGIAYFGVTPFWQGGQLHALLVKNGYISVAGNSVIFPSLGMNVLGRGIASFTLAGPGFFPSAAYMPISLFGSGDVHIASAGAAPEDGFTCYSADGVCRWGDYSAAVAAPDGSIWMASEYVSNLPRTSLANWGTFVSRVTP